MMSFCFMGTAPGHVLGDMEFGVTAGVTGYWRDREGRLQVICSLKP